MGNHTGTLRRLAGVTVLAVGMLAITGPGAQAAQTSLPKILNGKADSQALRISLSLPGTAELNNTLRQLGLGAVQLPGNLAGITLVQVVSLNHGEVMRADESIADHAQGFAAPLAGQLLKVKAESRCDRPGCGASRSTTGQRLDLLGDVVPGGIGYVEIARATSATRNIVDTRNIGGLVTTNVNASNLIGPGKPLAAVGDALRTVTTTFNDSVLPIVNPLLEQVEDTIYGLLPEDVRETLDDYVTLGTISPIPDLSRVDLLNASVMPSRADVFPATRSGVKGLFARSSSKVTDIGVLRNPVNGKSWAFIDAVGLATSAYANGRKGAADADADARIVGANLGGLLGIDIDRDDIARLLDPNTLKDAVNDIANEHGLGAIGDDLVAAIDLLYNVAGITVEFFGKTTKVDPKGQFANASAGTLALHIEPKIPLLQNASLPTPDAIVPRLGPEDYVSTGISLDVELPSSSAAVSVGRVFGEEFPPPGKTGVGFNILGALFLLAGAVIVRRFAMAK